MCSLRSRPIVTLSYLEVVESPLEVLDGLDSLRMRNDLARIPLLSSLGTTSRISNKKSPSMLRCSYFDPLPVCMYVRLTR